MRNGRAFAGRYPVEGILGRGGMGIVLSARHPILDRRVAIKVLLPSIAESDEYRQRFLNEARAGSLIQSEHVVRVLDVAMLPNGQPYIVMEHLDGCTLASILADRGRVSVSECVGWIVEALDAIASAHVRGIVHRDLKPQNLFLAQRSDGSQIVKVLDFGISKVTTDGETSVTSTDAMLGTPSYVSPEQARSTKLVDARTDIWSIGVVLFELLSGRRPFRGENVGQVIASVLTEDPMPLDSFVPDVPPELAAIVRRCLSRDPDDRFATASALSRALAPFAPPRVLPVIDRIERTQPDAPTVTFRETVRPRKLRNALLASAGVALALTSILFFSRISRATDLAAEVAPAAPSASLEPLVEVPRVESPAPSATPSAVSTFRAPPPPSPRKPQPMKPSEASLMSSTRD